MKKNKWIFVMGFAGVLLWGTLVSAIGPLDDLENAAKKTTSNVENKTNAAISTGAQKGTSAVKQSATKVKEAALVKLNSASKEELMKLKGMKSEYADKIIAGRPYKTKSELTSKKIIPNNLYQSISKFVTVE